MCWGALGHCRITTGRDAALLSVHFLVLLVDTVSGCSFGSTHRLIARGVLLV